MKKTVALLIAVLVMTSLVVPSFAQDDDDMAPTITDIVIEAASMEEDAEFTFLLTAVLAADEAVGRNSL